MKIIYLLFFLFSFLCDGYLYSQNFEYSVFPPSKEKREKIKNRIAIRDSIDLYLGKRIANNNIVRAGYYLKQSANFQYGALGCAAISATCFWAASKCKDKIDGKGEVMENENKSVWLICGGTAAVSVLFCEIMSITYKLKAGKSLMFKSSPVGLTASLTF